MNNNKNISQLSKGYVHVKFHKPRKLGTGRDVEAWRETKRKDKVAPSQMPNSFLKVKCEYVMYDIPDLDTRKKVRSEFAYIRKTFLMYLAENKKEELLKEGITKKQISSMRNGSCPKAYNVHHILPIHGGGSNDFSNLCIIRAKPVHERLHNEYINPQIRAMKDGDKRKIKIPKPTGFVFYTPENIKANTNNKINAAIINSARGR